MASPAPNRTLVVDASGMMSWPWLKWLQDLALKVSRPLQNLPVYANNAAAITGGLKAGDAYRTGVDPDVICVVH